ncbi:hypothetical protein M427DRAFT_56962 [Gonapodya prolifera JEL478]|uniref:Uncharacterized protein n=1 Tax=Gonapodya prolifera (strain JEL478) TaxID=1344416 RepID=A0A139AEF2_GONPJ|nr:hypothetical protein M427DRAFT_56962 [Gonapodya prolifera JEL478]|eukprot:KXS15059.1 hypothetical protein M427DRAFT_56962 [Gonapodya prolifera JEL478]
MGLPLETILTVSTWLSLGLAVVSLFRVGMIAALSDMLRVVSAKTKVPLWLFVATPFAIPYFLPTVRVVHASLEMAGLRSDNQKRPALEILNIFLSWLIVFEAHIFRSRRLCCHWPRWASVQVDRDVTVRVQGICAFHGKLDPPIAEFDGTTAAASLTLAHGAAFHISVAPRLKSHDEWDRPATRYW